MANAAVSIIDNKPLPGAGRGEWAALSYGWPEFTSSVHALDQYWRAYRERGK
jgi:hypothetical protein